MKAKRNLETLSKQPSYNVGKSIIRNMGLLLIGCYCLLSAIFNSNFTELHISPPFLNFPIFIGEMLLMVAIPLCFIFKWPFTWEASKNKYLLFGIYLAWVLSKALSGYLAFGPLSLRNAALFYYPIFFVLGLVLFESFAVDRKMILLLLLGSLLGYGVLGYDSYFQFPFLISLFVMVVTLLKKKREFLILSCIPLFFLSQAVAFKTLSHWVGLLISLGFLSFVFFGIYFKSTRFKIISLIVACGVLLSVFGWKSREIFSFGDSLVSSLKAVEMAVGRSKLQVSLNPIKPQLYSPHNGLEITPPREALFQNNPSKKVDEFIDLKMLVDNKMSEAMDANTILFRLFIWKDMIAEWMHEAPVFGISFGKPQRSRTIEALQWAYGEWSRDGWISPHNSYLDILYRGGVVGFLFLLGMAIILFKTIHRCVAHRLWEGILLFAIVIYWMVHANFCSFLELPQTAIPFWFLWGMIYARSLKAIRS